MKSTAFRFAMLVVLAVVALDVATVRGDEASAAKLLPKTVTATHSAPHWLGGAELRVGDKPSIRLSKTFVSTAAVQSAEVRMASDFCRMTVVINGLTAARVEPYCQAQTFVVTDAIKLGENRIEIVPHATTEAQAFVALSLIVSQVDGRVVSLVTDDSWNLTNASGSVAAAKPQGQVAPQFWGVDRRDIRIDRFENYEQWQQAKGGSGASPRFFVAPGFEIAQLRVAQPDEGSWVSMAVDERGRIVIAREDQGFLRLTLADDGKSVRAVQPIPFDLLECRGLVFRDGWLFASANNSKKLFKLRLGEDGQVTDASAIREFPGGVGHGRNDLSLFGERLYWIFGDSVDPPSSNIVDHTSPLRKQVAGNDVKEGSLLRLSLDGKRWELLSAGLRNPYGIANAPRTGDAFTYDADNEFDLGMPWYRPTRVLHLLPGGDFGYREATKRIPPRFADQPDAAPPLIDIGRGSPTAVMFGGALRFPNPYREALFLLDWTYGRVVAVHLESRGAGYRAATELFLQGKPLNVTDVVAGADGAMYLITGGRKTQSALYRVAAVEPASLPIPKASDDGMETAHDAFARSIVERNRTLVEGLQTAPETSSADPLTRIRQQLDNPDPIVRYAARNALERRPVSEWRSAIVSASHGPTSLHGLLAAARTLDREQVPDLVKVLATHPPANEPIGRRLVWLRILELCLIADRDAAVSRRDVLEPLIVAAWDSLARRASARYEISVEGSSSDFRRRAALLLAALESPNLPELAARELLASDSQEDQIAGLMALRTHRPGWTPASRELRLETLAAMPQMVGGEGLPFFHAWLERETATTLTDDERTQYAARKAALTTPEPLPPARPVVKKWTLDELHSVADDATIGNAQAGVKLFREALCARCHRKGARGPAIGPDLTFVSGRFSRRDILDSIINPSKSVAENYRNDTIETADGRVLTGRLIPGGDFRSEKLRLLPDPLRPDHIVEIDKKSIESHQPSNLSPMPQGLLDSFTRDEIADLLAFLTQGPQ